MEQILTDISNTLEKIDAKLGKLVRLNTPVKLDEVYNKKPITQKSVTQKKVIEKVKPVKRKTIRRKK